MWNALKKIAVPAGLVMANLSLVSPVHAQEAQYVAPADELAEAMAIMEAMFPADTREQMMLDLVASMGDQMAAAMMQGPIFEEPGIRAIMEEFLAELPETMRPAIVGYLPQMINSTAIAYTREFTLEELRDISAFAATPSGKRYLAKVQSLLNDPAVAETNQAFFEEVSLVQQDKAQEIRQKVEAFLKENPEVLERLQAAGVDQGS